MAEFRCYLLDSNRKVMAIEALRALTLPRAVTKGILATVMRHAETFELWRNDLCVYVHRGVVPEPAATPARQMNFRRTAVDD
ncbi:MAG TPA: hypothetical protein VNG52_00530 [Stellaceae bacterium]|nr:hypothetical protein [Stellaceae bacterium]